ncbi:GLPGLI family protein [Nonlabens dokdonensis]|uniref:Porph_ging domain containing protein n=2 Tax=Nonlabens dokdonensis TaxID=328515 RepID=L7WCI4_NONDD|nr:GLPGLI family protein [Nonlabens dokdonensis]AGC76628.1 porph_ging domain containing protein [Nonlabens dokdonensis DSW-6]PZX44277.1 GLPGLI family protein [Nonlabens dokdonensis]
MKKSIVIVLTILFTGLIQAQEFYGEATYMSKTKMDMSWMPEGREMSPQQKKRIEERMKKMGEKTYVLKFNRNESSYKEEKELSAPGEGRGWGNFMGTMMGGEKYKNLKEGQWIEQRDMMGKTFLIKDSIPNLEWKITGETRMIGQYQAIKATAVKKNNELDWSSFRRRRGDSQVEKKKDSLALAEGKVDEVFEQDPEVEIIAWFTPQIPVQHGPAEYAGLPGLILEVSAGNTTLLCSKIVVNPEEKEDIKPATKGEVTTEEEYNVIFKEKMKEMSERFRGRGGRGGGRRG